MALSEICPGIQAYQIDHQDVLFGPYEVKKGVETIARNNWFKSDKHDGGHLRLTVKDGVNMGDVDTALQLAGLTKNS